MTLLLQVASSAKQLHTRLHCKLQDLASWSPNDTLCPKARGLSPQHAKLCVGCAAVLPLPPLSNRQFCSCRSLRCALKCHRTFPSETCTSSSSQAITTKHSLARSVHRLGPCSKSARHGNAVAGGNLHSQMAPDKILHDSDKPDRQSFQHSPQHLEPKPPTLPMYPSRRLLYLVFLKSVVRAQAAKASPCAVGC
ncbi:unnamed protein product [Symbiodinium sp. CCMP2592]|nr:unnamed protein product [Symbiodinium sp. CCMP2592]